ncbi:MAG: M48 family metalloprotease [Candidatus Poribacteria bacterium]|nr:M48 family metalloprotease [Candidatus Poribacteria bacterium]
MGFVSVPIIAALVTLFVVGDTSALPDNPTRALVAAFGLMWAPALAMFGVSVAIRRQIADDDDRRRWLFRMRRALGGMEFLFLAVFGYFTLYGGLPAVIAARTEWLPLPSVRQIVPLLPLLAALLVARLAVYEVQRVGRAYYPAYIGLQTRFLLLPLAPILTYIFLIDLFGFAPLGWQLWAVSHPWVTYAVPFALIGVAYVFAPTFLRLLWRTEPLQHPALQRRISELAECHGLRFRRVSVWFTGNTHLANAAVAGLFPHQREIFVTDWLLKRMDEDEVEAVIAHEMGHIRHGHMWYYLAFSASYFGVYLLVFGWLAQWMPPFLVATPLGLSLSIVTFFAVYFVVLFGFVSRQFERQADVFAARNATDPNAFIRALETLATLHTVPMKIRRVLSWTRTHPPIAERIEFAQRALAGDPKLGKFEKRLPAAYGLIAAVPIIIVTLFLARGSLFAADGELAELRASLLLERADVAANEAKELPDGDAKRRKLELEAATFAGEARDLIRPMLETSPNRIPPLLLIGLTGQYLDNATHESVRALERVLRLEPQHFGANLVLAFYYLEDGDADGARLYLDRAEAQRPNDPDVIELRQQFLRLHTRLDGQANAERVP